MAEAATSDKFAQVRGFQIEIAGAGANETDTAWESVSGGETHSPGHTSVGEITLRGAMTDKRAALCAWINETAQGKPWKRNVSITPVLLDGTIGETVTYIDCIITAYKPPRLVTPDEGHPCGPDRVEEEVRFIYRDWTIRA